MNDDAEFQAWPAQRKAARVLCDYSQKSYDIEGAKCLIWFPRNSATGPMAGLPIRPRLPSPSAGCPRSRGPGRLLRPTPSVL